MRGLSGEAPDTDGVRAPSEPPAYVSDLGESNVLGHDIADLVHSGAPPKPAIEVVENLDSVSGVVLLEVDSYLLAESPCPRHQTTTVGVARFARNLSCRPCQLEGLTLICAARRGIGPQESSSETTPEELTSTGSDDPRAGSFVLRRVARDTTLHGSGRFL